MCSQFILATFDEDRVGTTGRGILGSVKCSKLGNYPDIHIVDGTSTGVGDIKYCASVSAENLFGLFCC